jgi:D-glycero-D-manno-heptose 1,7-bisphosphate phosphatase
LLKAEVSNFIIQKVVERGEVSMPRNRAVFIDRDGTVNVEKEYLHRPEDFQFIPGAPAAIRLLNEAGFLVIVVTNQSGVGRGYYDEAAVRRLHRFMDEELGRYGASVDAYYFCPHHPRHGIGDYLRECGCRKPLPGMLHEAAGDFPIDLAASFIIGDKIADIEAGLAAGCRPLLVRTGYGAAAAAALPAGIHSYDDFLAAVRAILSGKERDGAPVPEQ